MAKYTINFCDQIYEREISSDPFWMMGLRGPWNFERSTDDEVVAGNTCTLRGLLRTRKLNLLRTLSLLKHLSRSPSCDYNFCRELSSNLLILRERNGSWYFFISINRRNFQLSTKCISARQEQTVVIVLSSGSNFPIR